MAPVAVRERMYQYQPVMKAHSDFVDWQVPNSIHALTSSSNRRTVPKLPGPAPDIAEHFPVEVPDEVFA